MQELSANSETGKEGPARAQERALTTLILSPSLTQAGITTLTLTPYPLPTMGPGPPNLAFLSKPGITRLEKFTGSNTILTVIPLAPPRHRAA